MFYQLNIAIVNHTEVDAHAYTEQDGLIERLEKEIKELANAWARKAENDGWFLSEEDCEERKNRTDRLVLVLERQSESGRKLKYRRGYYQYETETVDDNETIQSILSDFDQE